MEAPERVLVPFVNAPAELETLEYALETHPGAEITLLAVRTPIDEPMIEGGVLSLEGDDRTSLRDRVVEAISGVDGRERVTVAVAEGRPASVVVDRVAVTGPDRIVMSRRDRSRLERLLFGRSVADLVDARIDAPVTVVSG